MGDRLSRKERKKKAAYRERRGKGKLVIKKGEDKESMRRKGSILLYGEQFVPRILTFVSSLYLPV